MKNEDFSFLTKGVERQKSEPVLPLVSLTPNVLAAKTTAVALEKPEISVETSPEILVPWAPRTNLEWNQHLARLKQEKAAAWAAYDKQRGSNLRTHPMAASPAEIAAATARLPNIRAQIRLAKKRLSSWWWYPIVKWPPLSCHIINSNDAESNAIRFWTSEAKDQYMKHLICSLQEDEAFNVSLSKAITTDAANKKHSANRPFWKSKQKFELTESDLKKALGDFAAFKKKGNSKETPDEEAARRLASYSHGCQGTTIVTLPGSIANQTSRSGQTQNHRPSATE